MEITESHLSILRVIQADATVTLEELARQLSMSQSTLWRRMKELEESGVIRNRVAVLRAEEVGLTISAFVSVNLTSQIKKNREAFERLVADTPEIMHCLAVTGAQDYVLFVRTRDMQDFESVLMDTILSHPTVLSAVSNISLREHKFTTILPL